MSTFAVASKKRPKPAKKLFNPRDYQKKAIKFFIERPAAGAFLDPGLGKTMITYCAYEILKKHRYVSGMLVVTLLRPAYEVWPAEITKWGLPLNVQVLHGTKKNRQLREKADVYVINYEGLEWLLGELHRWNGPLPFNMLVFDESSRLRNTNTKRFKLIRKLIGKFRRRYILTGTPTPRSLENIFGQIFALDGGKTFGPYVTGFRRKYGVEVSVNGKEDGPTRWEILPKYEKAIYKKIAPLIIRFGDEELDMPKLIINDIFVDLPKKARIIYDDIDRDFITVINKDIVTAKNAGVRSQKCRQVANGGLYLKQGSDAATVIHDEKTNAVLEIIDELEGKPVLIGYEFHHDRDRLLKVLPKGTPWIGGDGVSMTRQREIIKAWNHGDLPVLLGQIHSIAYGLNLQESGYHIIMPSLIWDLEDYEQLIKRIWRQGQKAKKVFIHRIIARNTVDEIVVEALLYKGDRQRRLFTAMKAYAQRRSFRKISTQFNLHLEDT